MKEIFNFDGISIIGTKVVHSQVEGFGIIFKLIDYSIGFSSDTTVFEGLSQ